MGIRAILKYMLLMGISGKRGMGNLWKVDPHRLKPLQNIRHHINCSKIIIIFLLKFNFSQWNGKSIRNLHAEKAKQCSQLFRVVVAFVTGFVF